MAALGNDVGKLKFQSTPANFTAGDRTDAYLLAAGMAFQSTPANFTAGDGCKIIVRLWVMRFNPRPPISQRATWG